MISVHFRTALARVLSGELANTDVDRNNNISIGWMTSPVYVKTFCDANKYVLGCLSLFTPFKKSVYDAC